MIRAIDADILSSLLYLARHERFLAREASDAATTNDGAAHKMARCPCEVLRVSADPKDGPNGASQANEIRECASQPLRLDHVMPLSAFGEKSRPPSDDDLRAVLGEAYAPWRTLLELVGAQIHPMTEIWAFTSASTGWGLRLRHKERVILYMTPQQDQFLVSFVLGEKAVAAARAARLSATIMNAVEEAPKYAEGRGVRLTVKTARQLHALASLAQIKWQN